MPRCFWIRAWFHTLAFLSKGSSARHFSTFALYDFYVVYFFFQKYLYALADCNPLSPMNDQDRISPHHILTIQSTQVMRVKKNIIYGIISWSNTKFSEPHSREHYWWDLGSERVETASWRKNFQAKNEERSLPAGQTSRIVKVWILHNFHFKSKHVWFMIWIQSRFVFCRQHVIGKACRGGLWPFMREFVGAHGTEYI